MNHSANRIASAGCSDEEWQLRVQLAACYRTFVHYGRTDAIFTHLSARVPDNPQHYLINPYGLMFHEVCAGNLIEVDCKGRGITGDHPYNEAGHAIHSGGGRRSAYRPERSLLSGMTPGSARDWLAHGFIVQIT